MSDQVAAAKAVLRQEIRAKLKQIPTVVRETADDAIQANFLQ